MHKLLASLRKEVIILLRDIPGLIILFLLPIMLIMVVTLAQNFALNNQLARTKVLIVDEAKTAGTSVIIDNLKEARLFNPITELNGSPVTLKTANEFITEGDFQFGIVFYPGDTAIHILLDPTLNESFKATLANAIQYIIRGTQSKMAVDKMLSAMPVEMKTVVDGMIRDALSNMSPIREVFASKDRSQIKPNVIQNNVPGFILFAMFFVVLPLSGSLINEKKDVAFQRLRTLPVTMFTLLSSKVILYLTVCLIQFLLMLAVGIWVFPGFFGIPSLQLGDQYFAIAVATVSAGLASVGFGILVGAAATSHNQAALFGSVMVVVLGVISVTFLPIHVMPETFQYISRFSPIRWGIDNYLDLFIREGSFLMILPNCLRLISFFVLAITISLLIFVRRK